LGSERYAILAGEVLRPFDIDRSLQCRTQGMGGAEMRGDGFGVALEVGECGFRCRTRLIGIHCIFWRHHA
jgi:hypothetical protein